MIAFDTAQVPGPGLAFPEPVRIYTGLLGQIGDIIMFTATARRIKEIFPNSTLTFAVSDKYREAGDLVAGLPYVDRLFVTEHYFDLRRDIAYGPWHLGWPCDYRGEDEVAEQRKHDIVLETRPRHRRMPWWEFGHRVAEFAHQVGVPGPIDLRTEIAIPPGTAIAPKAAGRIVLHNDPSIDPTKGWPWDNAREFARALGPSNIVLLGNPGPEIPDTIDLRGQTTLAQAAAIISAARCYVGVDSGLMWIAGSLAVPTVGLYGTSYIAAYENIQPVNPNAIYLQAEGTLDAIPASEVLAAVDQLQDGNRQT
jgi:ADP-heptose:LPS heptosyltransferase